MAKHLTGPVLENANARGLRESMANLPVGMDADYIRYFNDFLVAQDYAAGDWVVTETDAAATEAIAADVVGGALLLTNTAADDDVVQLQSAEEWFKLTVGKKARCEIKFKISDATQSDIFVGFCTTDTTVIAGTTDSVGFRKSDGSTTLQCLTEDNTSETTSTACTVVADTYITATFVWDGVSAVKFYIDRSLVATHTATIEQTNKLALTICLQNGEGVAKTMTVDYIDVTLER